MSQNEARVFLGGVQRTLKYTTRSVRYLEKVLGKSSAHILIGFGTGGMETTNAIYLVIAGMQNADRQPTEDQVSDWFDLLSKKDAPETEGEETMGSLVFKLANAFLASLPGVPTRQLPKPGEKAEPAVDPTTPNP